MRQVIRALKWKNVPSARQKGQEKKLVGHSTRLTSSRVYYIIITNIAITTIIIIIIISLF